MAAVNLLPVPVVSGGLALIQILEWMTGRRLPPKWRVVFELLGVLVLIALFGVWFLAVVDLLLHG